MLTIQILSTALEAMPFATMTFPHFRPHLSHLSAAGRFLALGAYWDGKPVGLALVLSPQNGSAELLSLFIAPDLRRRGIASALLAKSKEVLAARGASVLAAVWMTGTPGAVAFEALLRRQGWDSPQPRMIIYRADIESLSTADWVHAFATLPAGHAIVSWADLRPNQLATLRQAVRFDGWIPPDLEPFSFAGMGIDGAPAEPRFNLACTAWDEVVGWNFAHHIEAETARFSCTFVRPDLQNQLLLLALWREAFMRIADSPYRQVSWAVAVHRMAMVQFLDHYLLPYARSRQETRGSQCRF